MRIIFFGADRWFSAPVLEALAAAGHEILLVVSKGEAAGKFKTVEAKTTEDILRFTIYDLRFTNNNRPDAIILAAFGPPFLPKEVLNWPKYGCLNVHASLLPRWRGASPVFAALAAGDKETGVSIMKMTEEIDRGPVLGQKKIEIRTPRLQTIRQSDNQTTRSDGPIVRSPKSDSLDYDTRESLTKRLGLLGGELIVETLKKLETGQIIETPQPAKSPTPYTRRLTKDSGRIDWSKSPIEIERFIRAVTPWPGALANAKFKVQSSKFKVIELKILKAHLGPQQSTINNQQLTIDLIQLPGKNPITWKQFLAGHPGAKFE